MPAGVRPAAARAAGLASSLPFPAPTPPPPSPFPAKEVAAWPASNNVNSARLPQPCRSRPALRPQSSPDRFSSSLPICSSPTVQQSPHILPLSRPFNALNISARLDLNSGLPPAKLLNHRSWTTLPYHYYARLAVRHHPFRSKSPNPSETTSPAFSVLTQVGQSQDAAPPAIFPFDTCPCGCRTHSLHSAASESSDALVRRMLCLNRNLCCQRLSGFLRPLGFWAL